MILIPSLEIAGGRLVLSAGVDAERSVHDVPLLEAARALRDAGAEFFQVVDLDSLGGGAEQGELLGILPEAGLPCQAVVGSVAAARIALGAGVDRVVLDAGLLLTAPELLDGQAMRMVARMNSQDAAQLLEALGESEVLRAVVTPARGLGAGFEPGELDAALAARGEHELLGEARITSGAQLQVLTDAGLAGVVAVSAYARVLAAQQRA